MFCDTCPEPSGRGHVRASASPAAGAAHCSTCTHLQLQASIFLPELPMPSQFPPCRRPLVPLYIFRDGERAELQTLTRCSCLLLFGVGRRRHSQVPAAKRERAILRCHGDQRGRPDGGGAGRRRQGAPVAGDAPGHCAVGGDRGLRRQGGGPGGRFSSGGAG